jgi:transketolase N-terminal domain/subunit
MGAENRKAIENSYSLFILSRGHASAALAAMAVFPGEDLLRFMQARSANLEVVGWRATSC